jgi:hypothetical protein
MRQETALELLTACVHGDGKMYKVSVMSLLLWEANVCYFFICNVQKNLTMQKGARSDFVFAVFSKVQIMLASVILCLCTGLEHNISQLECRAARKVIPVGLVLCNFFSCAFTLTQLGNLHHCTVGQNHSKAGQNSYFTGNV